MDREGRFTQRFAATEPFNLWRLVYLSDYVLQQSTFFRRAALEEVGWVDEDLHYAMDWDLLIRLGKKFGLHYIPEYLGALREYPEAKSFAGGSRRVEEIRRVLERHTGLRRAPGFWTYGLDTWLRRWQDRCARSPRVLRLPAGLLSRGVHLFAGISIMLILRHAQGLYPDGWAADRLKWMLPEGGGDVVIRGHVPVHPHLVGLALSAIVGGHTVAAWPVGPGDFEVRFPAPSHSGPFSFEVRSSRYRRPVFGTELSVRRMSFLLKSAKWAENGGTAP